MSSLDIIFAEQTEGTTAKLNRWLVSVGDQVQADQPVAELETDKVTVEIAAPSAGYVAEQLAELDQELEPGTLLGRLSETPIRAAANDTEIEVLFVTEDNEGTAATLGRWLVEPGQSVSKDQPLVEVETDKVVLEIVAPANGVVHSLAAQPGQPLAPGDLLAILSGSAEPSLAAAAPADGRGTERISPAVRKLMDQYAIHSLKLIPGTGEGGRVTRDNLLSWLEQRAPDAGTPESRRVPHSAMRRAIARNMMDSIRKSPHVTSLFEADMSAVAAHRAANKAAFAKAGAKLTYTAYFVAAAAVAMKAVPQVNSRFHQDHLQLFDDINIGVGTALGDDGLIVPVISKVQDRSLRDLAADLADKTERARNGGLTQEDLRGGTFTLSNHGVSGSLLASPIIINQPEVAILGIGKLEKRVRVIEVDGEDQIQIVPSCYVTLSIDHRALDAFQTNAWLAAFVNALETWPQES
ncbi:MAG: 2-oxo acid dehydrogenase subunit E2 [Lysobacterales bacterium]